VAGTPAPRPFQYPEPKETPKVETVTPAPRDAAPVTPKDETPADGGSLDAIIARIAREAARGAVNAEQVEAIARRVAEDTVSARGALRVEVSHGPERPTINIEGAHERLPEVLRILAGLPAHMRNVYLVGPAGCGKTTLAQQVAQALDLPFRFNGAIGDETKVLGYVRPTDGEYVSTAMRETYQRGGVYLFDEFDASDPNAVLPFNAALANGHADFPDASEPIARHADCYFLVAANTYGTGADRVYIGRNELDGATLDRFVIVPMGYDRKLEAALAGKHADYLSLVWKVRDNVERLGKRVVVSTRAIARGAALLDAGMPMADVVESCLARTMDRETWKQVSA
jgi:hypothetical protein